MVMSPHSFLRPAALDSTPPALAEGLPITAAAKRVVDVLGALLLLLLVLPLMLLAALAVRLDSPGPALYAQVRVGLGGRPFRILKFRSMVRDAERDGRPRWAAVGDPRVTRVGRVIRRTRIDELPQLWNVLRGEMSLVGPRPERPEFVTGLAAALPGYEGRHAVKPGLTGWAQVVQGYAGSAEEAAEKLRLDLYYVRNQSFALDLLILARTVRVVLLGEGAR
jgi:exopolysaccharide biosynthesis polyprenyl glycosylphosphotransferase